jgi:hypothetical protein
MPTISASVKRCGTMLSSVVWPHVFAIIRSAKMKSDDSERR